MIVVIVLPVHSRRHFDRLYSVRTCSSGVRAAVPGGLVTRGWAAKTKPVMGLAIQVNHLEQLSSGEISQ